FDVARSRRIEAAPGDKVLIRDNDKRLGLINGQVLTISAIALDGALQTKEGACVPAEFRQWCHGYVVTSHKAQGWTADSCCGTSHRQGCLRRVLPGPEVLHHTYPGQRAPCGKITGGKSLRCVGCALRNIDNKCTYSQPCLGVEATRGIPGVADR